MTINRPGGGADVDRRQHRCRRIDQSSMKVVQQQQEEARDQYNGGGGAINAGDQGGGGAINAGDQGGAAARLQLLYDYCAPAAGGGGGGGVSTRWSPSARQLAELQALFHVAGLRTPSGAQISHIAARLRRHGRIEARNVFYWFQNQKARERKHKKLLLLQQQLQAAAAGRDDDDHDHDDHGPAPAPAPITAITAITTISSASCSSHPDDGMNLNTPLGLIQRRMIDTASITDGADTCAGGGDAISIDGRSSPAGRPYTPILASNPAARDHPNPASAPCCATNSPRLLTTSSSCTSSSSRSYPYDHQDHLARTSSTPPDDSRRPATAAALLQLFPLSPLNSEEGDRQLRRYSLQDHCRADLHRRRRNHCRRSLLCNQDQLLLDSINQTSPITSNCRNDSVATRRPDHHQVPIRPFNVTESASSSTADQSTRRSSSSTSTDREYHQGHSDGHCWKIDWPLANSSQNIIINASVSDSASSSRYRTCSSPNWLDLKLAIN